MFEKQQTSHLFDDWRRAPFLHEQLRRESNVIEFKHTGSRAAGDFRFATDSVKDENWHFLKYEQAWHLLIIFKKFVLLNANIFLDIKIIYKKRLKNNKLWQAFCVFWFLSWSENAWWLVIVHCFLISHKWNWRGTRLPNVSQTRQ